MRTWMLSPSLQRITHISGLGLWSEVAAPYHSSYPYLYLYVYMSLSKNHMLTYGDSLFTGYLAKILLLMQLAVILNTTLIYWFFIEWCSRCWENKVYNLTWPQKSRSCKLLNTHTLWYMPSLSRNIAYLTRPHATRQIEMWCVAWLVEFDVFSIQFTEILTE